MSGDNCYDTSKCNKCGSKLTSKQEVIEVWYCEKCDKNKLIEKVNELIDDENYHEIQDAIEWFFKRKRNPKIRKFLDFLIYM